jgi:hypothetical protein
MLQLFYSHCTQGVQAIIVLVFVNPLNAELNPICYLPALLRAHHILHITRIRVQKLCLLII